MRHPDIRMFALPIMTVFAICIIYSIAALAQPKLVPFSNHPKEVHAVVPSATAQPAAVATPTAAAPAGPSITLIAQNILFDKSTLTAKAGPLTIILENKDNGTPHNLQVFQGKDPTGKSMGLTDIAAGPVTQTLSLNLTAGTYYYHCDVHPTTMTGILTVT
ncbi:MAG TPA: cupredoxin domain-containing protein [Dehalococcoidia bacterium]|nr:cupredoxin domain-containing protein [Dehalococcoidia bacterium]